MSKDRPNRPSPDDDCPPAPAHRPDPPWQHESPLTEALSLLAREVRETREHRKIEFDWFKSHVGLATKCDLKEMECKIMSAISDWVATNGPKLERIQTGLDAVQALVEKLQNTPGTITPEDQALLNQIEAKIDAIAGDADSVPVPPAP